MNAQRTPLPVATRAAVKALHFDPQNPRLFEHGSSDDDILLTMWRDFAVNEVATSIAINGYWEYEPLLVDTLPDGRQIVIEGNRRLAALKLLLDDKARVRVGATDLPGITPQRKKELETVPVIETNRKDAWRYVGFKHVNGPQAWQSYSKAQYIGWVHNQLEVPLDEIAETIGDKHATVSRLYRGLMVLDQAEAAGVWTRDDRSKRHFSFSHLYVGVNGYVGIQKHLGLDGPPPAKKNPIAKNHVRQLGELMVWLYGSKSQGIEPLVQSQNPHLRQLDQVLLDKNSTAAVRSGMPLTLALDVAKGDAAKLRENLVATRRLLQDSRGKVLTGFTGEIDLLELADEISVLSESIVEDMRSVARRLRSRKRALAEDED